MTSVQSPKAPRMRQARKSIAHVPTGDTGGGKENLTVDTATIGIVSAQKKQDGKKTRSKSIGPGGLDALREDAGNKQVGLIQTYIASQELNAGSLLYHLMSSQF